MISSRVLVEGVTFNSPVAFFIGSKNKKRTQPCHKWNEWSLEECNAWSELSGSRVGAGTDRLSMDVGGSRDVKC